MSEHDPQSDEPVEDLDVPESDSEQVKGGMPPAWDKKSDDKFDKKAGGWF
jgi:hypothetical protein